MAGVNYLVKIRVGEGVFDFIHAKIFVPLPHTRQAPILKGIQANKVFEDALDPTTIAEM